MEIEAYLTDRIAHLKNCEWEYFEKSQDKRNDLNERMVYRNFSNEFEARRKELQLLQSQFLKGENAERQTKPATE